MWFNRKPKTDVSGCLAMVFLFGMAILAFITLLVMVIFEGIFR